MKPMSLVDVMNLLVDVMNLLVDLMNLLIWENANAYMDCMTFLVFSLVANRNIEIEAWYLAPFDQTQAVF